MAQIDVTSNLSDPDFVDIMAMVKRTPTINSFGENTLTETSISTVGSIQPAPAKVIQRLPEALQVANISSFWLKGKITVAEPGKYTDILVFRNQRYQVQTVADWSNFGEGYSEGTCVAEVPAP